MVAYDITERPVFGLGAQNLIANYKSSGATADCAIGGIPFQFTITDQTPYSRQTLDFRRQQIDTSREPGEQSLSQWWVRDQDSWHRGAGSVWYEPGSNLSSQYRYSRSVGVNVWEKGNVTLLRRMDLIQSGASSNNAYVTGAVVNNADVLFHVTDGQLRRDDTDTTIDYTGSITLGSTPVIAGAQVLVGSTDGIYAGSTFGSSLSLLWQSATNALVTPWWVKARIIAARSNSLYELTLAGGDLDAQTALWAHPSTTFVWTGVAEAPGAILACGRDGGYGYVYKFLLEDGGGAIPTLGAAIPIATFPPGEECWSMATYLGAYVALGTSRGVRIGVVDANGDLTYGPLTVETTLPVRALGARDRFVYASIEQDIDGFSGCARIDLGEEIPREDGQAGTARYAWAYDVMTDSASTISSVTFLGTTDRVALGVNAAGVYLQSADFYLDSGYVLSGRVRFATVEDKQFQLLRLRASLPSDCGLGVATVDSSGFEISIYSLDADSVHNDLTLGAASDMPQQYLSIRTTLTASGALTATPTLQALQVKALPAPRVQRTISVPVTILDFDVDRQGVTYGYEGAAADRLASLEELEGQRRVVVFEDYTSGHSSVVQIRSVTFVRRTPPARRRRNFGGLAVIELVQL